MKLAHLSLEAYIREVLPDTHAMWGGRSDFPGYVEHIRRTARGARTGSRPFTVGIRDGERLVSSCKLYDRSVRTAAGTLTATGIGAVFTPPDMRGRGYASAMLGMVLDGERADGRDLAFLYSDIHPVFYERLGFQQLPARKFGFPASALEPRRLHHAPIRDADWPGIRKCFAAAEREQPWGFRRTASFWARFRRRTEMPAPKNEQNVRLVSRSRGAVVAYVIGSRELRADAFWLDEFGFANPAGRAAVPALVRAAAGDLRKITGWSPPVAGVLPGGRLAARKTAILMIAALSPQTRAWWREERDATLASPHDRLWIADHV